jgi:hypothetical protein
MLGFIAAQADRSNGLETYRSTKLDCAATRHTVENAGSGLIPRASEMKLCHRAQGSGQEEEPRCR